MGAFTLPPKNTVDTKETSPACSCHATGSEHPACNVDTGQCNCRGNVTGRACDQCLNRHWGIDSGFGCRPCDCNPIGSLLPTCDGVTGQCVCKPGVGGLKCDTCVPNYYGFSMKGCSKCQECKLLGHVCHSETGRCVCPPHTQGVHCQTCTPDAWGYEVLKGCKPCECDSGGSTKSQCDFNTGECTCRKGFRGTRCDTCDNGYYNFPFCKACDCEFGGTLNETCDATTGRCRCDNHGVCRCKPNVIGKKCDTCKSGTFGIQAENPNGCTACFCFGRSASCTQAGLHWSQIRAGRSRSVVIEYDPSSPFKNTLPIDSQQICYINLAMPGEEEVTINGLDTGLNVTNNLRTLPGDSEDIKIGVSFLIDTPVYWKLPRQFLGDKVLSYGGYLKFLVETEGGNTQFPQTILATYPLVQLQGNGKIVLQHFPLLPNKFGKYEVRLHESLWQDKYQPDRKVSRETFMVALQNIQHILIRASESADFNKAVLRDVSLDTAAASTGLELAGGVELCECPPEYNSTSCQDPSIGFFRWYDKDVNTATILIQLVGEARPCDCNNRSTTCDIETGFCQKCAHNTGGPHCERCGEGYYGDPSSSPCLSCPCPSPERNFAVSCHVAPGREPICNCKPGYSGQFCERCAYGWFGRSETPGGSCQPCKCNVFGSVSDECDEKTGQCNCRPGINGRDCSVCPEGTVLTHKGCSDCEDDCSGLLIKDFKKMTKSLETRVRGDLENLHAPWEKLKELERKLTATRKSLRDWKGTTEIIDNLIESNIPHEFKTKTKNLLLKAHSIEGRAKMAKNDASYVRKEAENLVKKIKDVNEDVDRTIENLKFYSENRESAMNDSAALSEAVGLLEEIKNRDLIPKKQEVEEILDHCTGVLNRTMHMTESFPEVWEIKEKLKILHEKLEELEGHIKRTIELSQKRFYQANENQNRIIHLKKKLGKFTSQLEEVDDVRGQADNLLFDADSYLTEVEENIKNLTGVKSRLANATELLKTKEGILQNLNPLYRNKYVKPAQMHAAILMKKAKELKDLFNTTSDTDLALAASKRYQDIIDDLEIAKMAAKDAINSELMYKIFPPEFEKSVLNRSDVLKILSTRLKDTGAQQGEKNVELRDKLDEVKKTVDKVEDTVRQIGTSDNKLSGDIYTLENKTVEGDVKSAMENMENMQRVLEEAKKNIEKVKEDMVNDLKQKIGNMGKEDSVLGLLEARKDVQNSLSTNRNALKLAEKLNRTSGEHTKLPSLTHLTNRLTELKNKITEAKHTAESIRLSLSSNSTKGCVRSFKVSGLQPTTTGRLALTLTVDPLQSNRIIFFLPSSTTVGDGPARNWRNSWVGD
ncbi:hypothetical protein RUM44_006919 [Polyplax serrata]|uniref:Uncharacterized protein n=1 Tax=Polyplax serrata TaxID=468196 RepID=A0ABR1AZQ5_POLSC